MVDQNGGKQDNKDIFGCTKSWLGHAENAGCKQFSLLCTKTMNEQALDENLDKQAIKNIVKFYIFRAECIR